MAMVARGRPDEAIAEYREAIRIDKDFADAHCDLGLALWQQGAFRLALEALRRGHELGQARGLRWRNPSAQWVRQCERMVDLDERLPELLAGKVLPASAVERVELAQVCGFKRLNGAACRFYEEAFAVQPGLAAAHRYNAARAAAQAGCGQGKDTDKLDDRERASLRRQALGWLRADLEARGRLPDREPDRTRSAATVARVLDRWVTDPDFVGVREPEQLAKLPEAERPAWQKLWAEVADTLARARHETKPETGAR
jgi:serine/threonine-protein kinase